MSYILDALKHSDRQKNRGAIPTLQTQAVTVTQTAEHGSLTPWLWALGALTLIVLGYVWLYPSQTTTASIATQPPVQQAGAETVREQGNTLSIPLPVEVKEPPLRKDEWLLPAESLAGLEGVKLSLTDPDAQEPVKPRRTEAPRSTAPATVAAYTKPAREPARLPVTQPVEVQPDPYAGISHIKQLDPALQRQIPEMVFSVHIYSDQPTGRLVKVNGTRYREGAQITGDLKLVEITRDGAIFTFKDTRFWRGAR